jgi:hypothetical protein
LIYDGHNAFCHLVVDGKIARRPVKLGIRSGADVEVVDGLSDAEQVVVLQPAAFKPGQAVEVREGKAK